ncbi:MAG: NAD-dependent epimerase/dehydratase family protein [Acidimicrobiales bacterium]
MRTVITGGGGFLGVRLASMLLAGDSTVAGTAAGADQQVVLADRAFDRAAMGVGLDLDDPRLTLVELDLLGDPSAVDALVEGADEVVHLASVVSADAEADPERAWLVNVEGTRRLLGACARRSPGCRVLAASSVAVFRGGPDPSGDHTKPGPGSTYGMTKAILELLINEATRRGEIDGRVARLPTVIVRPGKPNLAASSFASGVFREPLQGVDCVVPVGEQVPMVLIGVRTAVAGLFGLLRAPAARLGPDRGVNLPGLCVTVGQMVTISREVGATMSNATLGSITLRPDPGIEAIVAGWPGTWDATAALALDLPADTSLRSVVEDFAADIG